MNTTSLFRKAPFLSFDQQLTMSSLHQLHSLLQQWNLVSSSSSARSTTSIRPLSGLDGRAVPTTHEPESRNAYERRPLPLLPRSSRSSSSRRARESHRAPSAMSHSQPEAVSQHRHRHRRVETELDSVSAHEGSSPLEKYVMDPQTHEMIAIGMVQPWRQGRSSL